MSLAKDISKACAKGGINSPSSDEATNSSVAADDAVASGAMRDAARVSVVLLAGIQADVTLMVDNKNIQAVDSLMVGIG